MIEICRVAVRALDGLNIGHVDVFPAGAPDLGPPSAAFVVTAITDFIYHFAIYHLFICQYLPCSGADGFYGAFVHPSQSLIPLAMVICTDIKVIYHFAIYHSGMRLIGNSPYCPAAADDGMRFEQLHGAVGVHLGRDDGAEVVFQINGVDGYLPRFSPLHNGVGNRLYLQRAGELLILVAVPMEADTDPHVL